MSDSLFRFPFFPRLITVVVGEAILQTEIILSNPMLLMEFLTSNFFVLCQVYSLFDPDVIFFMFRDISYLNFGHKRCMMIIKMTPLMLALI